MSANIKFLFLSYYTLSFLACNLDNLQLIYVADFTFQLNLIPHSGKPRLICFFGSTIDNFDDKDSKNIFQNLAASLNGADTLLVGFDLLKEESVLHAAYNDSQGVT